MTSNKATEYWCSKGNNFIHLCRYFFPFWVCARPFSILNTQFEFHFQTVSKHEKSEKRVIYSPSSCVFMCTYIILFILSLTLYLHFVISHNWWNCRNQTPTFVCYVSICMLLVSIFAASKLTAYSRNNITSTNASMLL